MAETTKEQHSLRDIITVIVTGSLFGILPATAWSLFGWMQLLVPAVGIYVPGRFGGYTGKRMLFCIAGLSMLAFLPSGSLDLYLVYLSLLVSGYVLHWSGRKGDSPALSGLKGVAALTLGWLLIIGGFSIGGDISPYGALIKSLDEGITEALDYYRQSQSVSADTLIMLEGTLIQMKVLLPLILPAIIGSMIMLVTWLAMILGNGLLVKHHTKPLWPRFSVWQVPEKLIWLLIATAAATLIPGHPLRAPGVNALVLVSLVYCFQGLAIMVFYMNKWNVPVLLRSFLYVLIVFQSLGTVALLIVGVAENWFDFRKLKKEQLNQAE